MVTLGFFIKRPYSLLATPKGVDQLIELLRRENKPIILTRQNMIIEATLSPFNAGHTLPRSEHEAPLYQLKHATMDILGMAARIGTHVLITRQGQGIAWLCVHTPSPAPLPRRPKPCRS